MAHAYWRIYVTLVNETSANTAAGIAALEFRATPSGADQASGGTASADSDSGAPWVAANAFDGNAATAWASANTALPHWLAYHFASAVNVTEISIKNRADYAFSAPYTFAIQYSDDGTNYTTAWSVAGSNGWATSETRVFTAPSDTAVAVASLVEHTAIGSAGDTKESVAAVVQHTAHGTSPTEVWAAAVAAHSVRGGTDIAVAVDMVVMHTVVGPEVFPPIDPVTGGIASQRITVSVDVSGGGGTDGTGAAFATQAALDQEITDRLADVDAEEAARMAADGIESAARIAADAAEATARATAVSAEAATRAAADTAEQTARIAADALKADISYVDAKVAGLSWKQAVRAATTAAGTLATSFENGDAIDGVTLATGDRILIKNQATGSENGIYIVAATGTPTRATDADSGAELVNASVYISEGSTLADTQWTCTTNAPITVGSTSVAFAQLASGRSTSPLIGMAAFSATGGAISGLAVFGIISNVTRAGAGQYAVTFTTAQPDVNYAAHMDVSDDNTAAMFPYYKGVAANYTTTGFSFFTYAFGPNTPQDRAVVRLTIFRYA